MSNECLWSSGLSLDGLNNYLTVFLRCGWKSFVCRWAQMSQKVTCVLIPAYVELLAGIFIQTYKLFCSFAGRPTNCTSQISFYSWALCRVLPVLPPSLFFFGLYWWYFCHVLGFLYLFFFLATLFSLPNSKYGHLSFCPKWSFICLTLCLL